MRLPVIKHIVSFIEQNDEDYVVETMETLEDLIDLDSLKDEELDVIGELLSNMSGALEVHQAIKNGSEKKTALNDFMKRVQGSIDWFSYRVNLKPHLSVWFFLFIALQSFRDIIIILVIQYLNTVMSDLLKKLEAIHFRFIEVGNLIK